MKRKFLVFGLLTVSSLYIYGQNNFRVPDKKRLSKTEIQLVYSHYLQDGNHSAVTGGTGTEKLEVYSPELTISFLNDSLSKFSINAGVDIISSASTDNIDFILSSASKVDAHDYLNLSYSRKKKYKPFTWSAALYGSLESDYLSGGASGTVQKTSADQSRTSSAELEIFLDDLRWGRLNGHNKLELVYPAELRSREWFNRYRRQSYNLNTSVQQIINRKTIFAVFPELSFQHGLLSTPFHRVYFKDSSVRVENLPENRLRLPIGFQLNRFLVSRFFLRTYYRFYWDNWGVLAHTAEIELPVKLSPQFSITPAIRLYQQKASKHFREFQRHDTNEEFYTSDYDLSKFTSYESSLELKFNAVSAKTKLIFNSVVLRYSYYKRSDGLEANTLSASIAFAYFKKKK